MPIITWDSNLSGEFQMLIDSSFSYANPFLFRRWILMCTIMKRKSSKFSFSQSIQIDVTTWLVKKQIPLLFPFVSFTFLIMDLGVANSDALINQDLGTLLHTVSSVCYIKKTKKWNFYLWLTHKRDKFFQGKKIL